MTTVRWLLVSSQHEPSQGGIGAYVSRFIDAAAQHGWDVDLMTRPGPRLPPAYRHHLIRTVDDSSEFTPRLQSLRQIERVRPYRYGLWSLAVARALLNIEPNYDAVEFVDCQAEGFVSLCSRRVRERWRGVPMLVHAHTPMYVEEEMNSADPGRFGRSIYHAWERHALETADGVMATSGLLTRWMPKVRSSMIAPFPLRIQASSPPSDRGGIPTILLVGSVQPRKGVEIWARSLNAVFDRHRTVRAELIGPDTLTAPGGTSMVDFITQLLDPQFHDRFRWLGGMEHDRVREHIKRASLVVVPSRLESFSFVAAEAIEAGTPVIVSDQVGLTEHVPSLPRVPVDDAPSLVEAQCLVLADLDRARRIADRCLNEFRDACAPARHFAQRMAFVESLRTAEQNGEDSTDHATDDAIDWMDGVLRSIEAEERASTVSSVRS